MQASPLAGMLAEATGAETDRAGHIEVLPDCTLPGHPEVFVVGDMMSLNGLPGVAEVAMQSGIHAARTIKRRVERRLERQAVRLSRPRQHGDDLALPRDRQLQGHQGRRVHRLADVGVRPPHVPDRLQEPLDRPVQVADARSSASSRDERTITMQQVSARIVAMRAGVKPGEEALSRFVDEPSA